MNHLTTVSLATLACLAAGCLGTPGTARAQAPLYVASSAAASTVTVYTTAQNRPMATVYRYGTQYDEYFVRGDAALSDSPVLARGIRLAAWDAEDPQTLSRVAVATAVYFVSVPAGARSLSIEVGYRNAMPEPLSGPAATAAGFLFVRNLAVERQYAAQQRQPDADAGPLQEPGFFGDSYLLLPDQARTRLDVPADDRISNGVLELHLSAGAGQALDIEYVQVTAQSAAVATVVSETVVEYVAAPYLYSYTYYYLGPWYRRDGYTYISYSFATGGSYVGWFTGWSTWRACFYTWRPWLVRPVYYVHLPPRKHHAYVDHRQGKQPYPATTHGDRDRRTADYRESWYRERFGIDAARSTPDDIQRRVRERPGTMTRSEQERFAREAREVATQFRRPEAAPRTPSAPTTATAAVSAPAASIRRADSARLPPASTPPADRTMPPPGRAQTPTSQAPARPGTDAQAEPRTGANRDTRREADKRAAATAEAERDAARQAEKAAEARDRVERDARREADRRAAATVAVTAPAATARRAESASLPPPAPPPAAHTPMPHGRAQTPVSPTPAQSPADAQAGIRTASERDTRRQADRQAVFTVASPAPAPASAPARVEAPQQRPARSDNALHTLPPAQPLAQPALPTQPREVGGNGRGRWDTQASTLEGVPVETGFRRTR